MSTTTNGVELDLLRESYTNTHTLPNPVPTTDTFTMEPDCRKRPGVGDIVIFYPGQNYAKLPNNMECAPAMVTQTFGMMCNLTLFLAQPDETLPNLGQAWSTRHRSDASPFEPYWVWKYEVI